MIIVFGTEEQLKRNTCHGTSRDHRQTWLHGRHAAPRERTSCGAGAGPPRVPTARHGCHSSATHTPSPQDESLATEGGPSPLPWSTGPWERLPLALVSLAELTPDGRVLSMPAAKAGPSSQHAGQGAPAPSQRVMATAELPALSHWCPQGWPAGLWEQGVRQASLPRLRAAAPLLACPALHLQGTDSDSAGSGNRTQWDAAPQARAEPLAPDTTRPLPSCSGGLYEGAGTAAQGAQSPLLPPPAPPPTQGPRWGIPVLGQKPRRAPASSLGPLLGTAGEARAELGALG